MRTTTRPLFAALALAAASAAASTFTVSSSGSTFTVARSGEGTNAAETVIYRTVPLSASPGQHFTAESGSLAFAAGETSGKLSGYVLIDDSYDYSKKPATVSTATLVGSTGAPASYLDSLGYRIYAAVCFAEKERDDGYQYLQIVAGASSASYDTGADPNGEVRTPTNSVYKVCFELADGSNAEGNIYFPHRGTTSGEFSLSTGKLWQQKYKSGDYNGSGAVVLPVTTGSVTARFDAGGNNDDTWGYKYLFFRMALCDSTAPTPSASSVAVAPGRYGRGNTVYVSVPFDEPVSVTGTPTLHTDWGDFEYFAGSGSNVLTFQGAIDAAFGTVLVVRSLNGTVADLAGNGLASTACYKEFGGLAVALPWGGAGTEADPYVITTTNQLDYLAARVNATYGSDDFAGKYFVLAADLDYGGSSDWDGYLDNTTENNFTPVGCFGRSFGGHFDGQGHTVSGIRVKKQGSTTDDESSVGLFGFVSGGSVRNIVLRDCKFQGYQNVGGIVGYLSGGTVTNSTLYHVLAGTMWVGGSSSAGAGIVAGHDGGTVSGCHYRDCRVGTTYREETGLGGSAFPMVHNDRVDNVYAVALAAGVTATPAAVESVVIDDVAYYAAGSAVALVYDGTPAAGTEFAGFVVADENGGASFETDGAFAMPAYDATADSLIITEWAALNRRLAAGGDITLAKDYAATAEDGPLTVPEGVAVTLDLNGHILDRNLAAATNRGLVIDVRGSLAVTDGAPAATHTGALAGIPGGVITGGNSTDNGGGVQVYGSAATFTLSGGTVSGNSASWGGGVRVNGGSFTMEGGAVSGNTASIGGGVYVNSGTATLPGGTVTGDTASSYGCGVYVQSGGSTHFQISGGPVVSGNAVGGAPNNVHLASGKSIDVVGELTASARLGVTAEAGLGVFTDGLGDKGDATNFFSDDPAWRVRLNDDSGEAELFEPVVLPSYLAGADTVVTNNYLAWAAKYGSDTEGSYESCFLLDLPPWTEIPEGAALLKIVEMGVTNIPTASDYGMIAMAMGYQGEELPCRRLVLASDVAQLKRREDFDTPFETCNGYLVLRIGADLSLPLDEWAAASWIVEFADGRGEFVFPEIFLEGIRSNLERAAGKPLGGLFLRPCISPVPRLEWLEDLGILVEDP